jgi:hypothetical protein
MRLMLKLVTFDDATDATLSVGELTAVWTPMLAWMPPTPGYAVNLARPEFSFVGFLALRVFMS